MHIFTLGLKPDIIYQNHLLFIIISKVNFCSDAAILSYIKQLNSLLIVIFRNQVSMTITLTWNYHYIPFHLAFFNYLQQAISQDFSGQEFDKEDY